MKKLLLPFFLVGSLVMIVVMAKTGATLKTPFTPKGILDLEFAFTTIKADAVMSAWSPATGIDNIAAAKTNTYWDFLFLFFYAGFLFLACKTIASKISGPVSKAGKLIAKGALAAGFLDILENIGMLLILNHHGSSAIVLVTTIVSLIKWALALIALLYVLTGLIALAFRKR